MQYSDFEWGVDKFVRAVRWLPRAKTIDSRWYWATRGYRKRRMQKVGLWITSQA